MRDIGQCREMWRFKTRNPLNRARDAVLHLDPFRDVSTVKPMPQPVEDSFQLNLDFQHIPESFARSNKWATQFSSPMRFQEHITILEGRATLQAIRRKLRCSRSFGLKHLHCGDNLGMVLAFDRGRAKAIPLLFCCRKAASYSVAGDCSFVHRWLPSEWNAADGPSRLWEVQGQKGCHKREIQRIKNSLLYPKSQSKSMQDEARKFIRWDLGLSQATGGSKANETSLDKERVAEEHPGQGRGHTGRQEAEACGRQHPEPTRSQSDHPGGRSRSPEDCTRVQAQIGAFQDFLQRSEVEDAKRERLRRSFAPLSQPVLHRGMEPCRRGQVPCSRVRLSSASSKGCPDSLQEGESGSRGDEATSSVAFDSSHHHEHGGGEPTGRGHGGLANVCHLREAGRSFQLAQEGLSGQLGARTLLGCEPSCFRGIRGLEGRCEQRDNSPQRSRASAELPDSVPEGPLIPSSYATTMEAWKSAQQELQLADMPQSFTN